MPNNNSLYGNTPSSTGNISSSNLTTLYSGNAVTVPSNGNLVVPGTLTINGCAILSDCPSFSILPHTPNIAIGEVGGTTTILSQLATANYSFPIADGTANQVLITNGSGDLSFADVQSLDTNYSIQADTTTGGANLTLVGSDSTTDSVKFASGTGVTVSRTDANTINIAIGQNVATTASPTFSNLTLTNNLAATSATVGGVRLGINELDGIAYGVISVDETPATDLVIQGGSTLILQNDFISLRKDTPSTTGNAYFNVRDGRYSFNTATDNGVYNFYAVGNGCITGDLAVNGDNGGLSADITTTKNTASLFRTNATTLNIGGAGTGTPTDLINIGIIGQTYSTNFGGLITQNNITTQAASRFLNQTTTSPIEIMSTTRRSMKGHIVISDDVTGAIQSVEFLAIRKTSTAQAYITIYAEIFSDAPLATFTVADSGGSLRLYATLASTNSTDISIMRHSLGD